MLSASFISLFFNAFVFYQPHLWINLEFRTTIARFDVYVCRFMLSGVEEKPNHK